MSRTPVRASPISRTAAILIMALGIFTLLFVNDIAGVAFLLLGAFLYVLLYRFTAKIERELRSANSQAP